MSKPFIAIHKFSSCDGCQLAFLNNGEMLITLSDLVNIVHFAEAGFVDEKTEVDIAFVEGSVSTEAERKRIQGIRNNSRYLITIGACATAGGLQALRNFSNAKKWVPSIYATPQYISTLDSSTPISSHVKVDLELWGCPIDSDQIFHAIRVLLFGVSPFISRESICLECKRRGNVCVMVAQGKPCMGPVTQTGCGAICPYFSRACYGCFGPSENSNVKSLGQCFKSMGLLSDEVVRRFWMINSAAEAFKEGGYYFQESE